MHLRRLDGEFSGGGICGVFAVVSGGYWGGIWGYLGVFAPRGRPVWSSHRNQDVAFRVGGVAKMAVGGPSWPRQNITENRDDQTSSIILERESDIVMASSLF